MRVCETRKGLRIAQLPRTGPALVGVAHQCARLRFWNSISTCFQALEAQDNPRQIGLSTKYTRVGARRLS